MALRSGLCTAAFSILAAGAAHAQAEQAAETRQLGAHVHGAAALIAAADADGLLVAELSSPAWNLYGFEGAPASSAQRTTIEEAAARLAAPGLVTVSGAARCTLAETIITGGPEMNGDAAAHPSHGHDDDGHDDHDHNDHDDHDDADAGGGHDDVVVSWTFQCDRPDRLTALDLSGLFTAFGRLEQVEVQYLDAGGAAARTLTPGGPVLRLD